MTKIRNKLLVALLSLCLIFCCVGFIGSFSTAKAVAEPETVAATDFYVLNGAQMRVTDPAGLRFTTIIGSDVYNSVVDVDGDVKTVKAGKSLGMFIISASYLEDYEAYKTANTDYTGDIYDYCKNVKGKIIEFNYSADQIFAYKDGYCIKAVVVNVLFDNLNRDYIAISYIRTTVGETETYQYADYSADGARSIAYVASAAVNAGEGNTFIEECQLNAAYNALGVTFDTDTNKYMYQGTAYDALEDISAVDVETVYALDETEKAVNCGGTVQINPNAAMKKLSIDWSTSNKDVATVDANGLVTAVGSGSAVITAKAGAIEKTCVVTVNHENQTTLKYGVIKIDNCSCGANGTFATNKIDEKGFLYNSDFSIGFGEGVPAGWTAHSRMNTVIGIYDTNTSPENNPKNTQYYHKDEDETWLGIIKQDNNQHYLIRSDAFEVKAGENYKITFDYCTTSNNYNKPTMKMVFFDANMVELSYASPAPTVNPWGMWAQDNNFVENIVVPNDAKFAVIETGGAAYTASSIYYDDIRLTKYGFNVASATLSHNETLELSTVGAFVGASLEWTTSDDTIATVVDGVVTASANNTGVVTITATANGLSAVCTITVKHDETNVENLSYGVKKVSCSCGYSGLVASSTLNADGSFYNSDFELGTLDGWDNYTRGNYSDGTFSANFGAWTKDTVPAINNNNVAVNATAHSTVNQTYYLGMIMKYTDSGFALASDAFEITAGTTYNLNIDFCNSNSDSDGAVYINILFFDADMNPISYTTPAHNLAGWNLWKVVGKNAPADQGVLGIVAPANAKYASIEFGNKASATVGYYFDNVKLIAQA